MVNDREISVGEYNEEEFEYNRSRVTADAEDPVTDALTNKYVCGITGSASVPDVIPFAANEYCNWGNVFLLVVLIAGISIKNALNVIFGYGGEVTLSIL